jgi:hypothetical protein
MANKQLFYPPISLEPKEVDLFRIASSPVLPDLAKPSKVNSQKERGNFAVTFTRSRPSVRA